MGLRNSKSKKSYDVAAVVSNKDFTYARNAQKASGEVPKAVPTNAETPAAATAAALITAPAPVPAAAPTAAPESTPTPTPASITAPVPDVVAENVAKDAKDSLPEWLNETQFVDILKAEYENFVKITNFDAKPALSAGENYSTVILRVRLDILLSDESTKTVSYMLKVPPDSPHIKQILALNNFFNTEKIVYFDVIPQLEQIYRERGVNVSFGPKAFKLPDAEYATYALLLDDLGQLGYKNANRLECLTEDHMKVVLKKLAQFHAVSAHYYTTKGPFPDILMTGMFKPDDPNMRVFMEAMIGSFKKSFLDNINLYKNGESYYKSKLENLFANMADTFIQFASNDANEFKVLNHGDFWCNNVLFRSDDSGKVADALFVDFQNPKFGSFAQDLQYIIISSAHIDLKLKKFDYFVRYYHENLVEHLNLLEYSKEIPTLRQVHNDLLKYGVWAVMTSLLIMPVVLMDPTGSATGDNFTASHEDGLKFKNLLYTNQRYVEYMEQVLPWLDNRGFLDI